MVALIRWLLAGGSSRREVSSKWPMDSSTFDERIADGNGLAVREMVEFGIIGVGLLTGRTSGPCSMDRDIGPWSRARATVATGRRIHEEMCWGAAARKRTTARCLAKTTTVVTITCDDHQQYNDKRKRL